MAVARIEPTGISVRKGKVQIRFCFYLDLTDARYDEHHVQVSVIPDEGYLGEVDDRGRPIDIDHYKAWLKSLPKIWQNNPFHNHFVRVSHDVTDGEISKLMQESLAEFYGIWSRGEDILKVWKPKREMLGDESPENISRCELKGLDIANRASAFEYRERR